MIEDRFREKTTGHLRSLMETSDAIRAMYLYSPDHENIPADPNADLLREKANTPIKGLVWKYPGRVLMLLSYTCAANCRYCERQDRVGVGLDREGHLTSKMIHEAVDWVANRVDISEVIFSGGDPLTNPHGLRLASRLLAELPHVRILRIHTRFPLQMPNKVDFDLLRELSELRPAYYISLHIDHPDELTGEVETVIERLRRLGFILLCQSVFLKGINDSVEILAQLFERLAAMGVRPYYIYHCQSIPTTARFVMPLADEIAIMTKLRERVSGLAFPQHVIDMQHTTGKIVVPTRHWRFDESRATDFVGNERVVAEPELQS